MGSLGSAYFIGWVMSSLLIPYYSDRYGRKLVVFSSTIIASISSLGLIFSRSLMTSCILLFVNGFTASGVFVVSFCYNMEMLTPHWQPIMGTLDLFI
jgi:MFS family permease